MTTAPVRCRHCGSPVGKILWTGDVPDLRLYPPARHRRGQGRTIVTRYDPPPMADSLRVPCVGGCGAVFTAEAIRAEGRRVRREGGRQVRIRSVESIPDATRADR